MPVPDFDTLRAMLLFGIAKVPEVGGMLSALVALLWPLDPASDPWDALKDRIEAMMDRKLDQALYRIVQEILAGLGAALKFYLQSLVTHDPVHITAALDAVHVQFVTNVGRFQEKGHELLYLPLFAQVANLHLQLLRDAVLNGRRYGLSEGFVTQYRAAFAVALKGYVAYAQGVVDAARRDVRAANPAGSDPHRIRPCFAMNELDRRLHLLVLDFVTLWPYADPDVYPGPVAVKLQRELVFGPFGIADDTAADPVPLPAPDGRLLGLQVWGGSRIDAVRTVYTPGGGPRGCTDSGRQGGPGGNDMGTVSTDDRNGGPIVALDVYHSTVWDGLQVHQDGRASPPVGHTRDTTRTTLSQTDHILSSVAVCATSDYYAGIASAVMFGFQLRDQGGQVPPQAVLQAFYVGRVPAAWGASGADDAPSRTKRSARPGWPDIDGTVLREGWDEKHDQFWRAIMLARPH